MHQMDYAMRKKTFLYEPLCYCCNYTKAIISHACCPSVHTPTQFSLFLFLTKVFFKTNISDSVVRLGNFMQLRSSSLKSSFPTKRTKQGMAQLITSVDSLSWIAKYLDFFNTSVSYSSTSIALSSILRWTVSLGNGIRSSFWAACRAKSCLTADRMRALLCFTNSYAMVIIFCFNTSREIIYDAWRSDFSVVAIVSFAWKTVLAASPASCSALVGGCKGTVHVRYCHWPVPPVRHSLRKQPRDPQCKQRWAPHRPLVTFRKEYKSRV